MTRKRREKLEREILWARNRFEAENGREPEPKLPLSLEPERILEKVKLQRPVTRRIPVGRIAASFVSLVLVVGAVSLLFWHKGQMGVDNLSLARSVESAAGFEEGENTEAELSKGTAMMASDPYQPVYDCLERLWMEKDENGWKQSGDEQELGSSQLLQQQTDGGSLELTEGTIRYTCSLLEEGSSQIVVTNTENSSSKAVFEVEFTVRSMMLWQDRLVLAGQLGESTVLQVYDTKALDTQPDYVLTQDGIYLSAMVTEDGSCYLLTGYQVTPEMSKDEVLPAIWVGEQRTVPAEDIVILDNASLPGFFVVSEISLAGSGETVSAAVLGGKTVQMTTVQDAVWLCIQTQNELTLMALERSEGELILTELETFTGKSYLLEQAGEGAVLVMAGEENYLYLLDKTGHVLLTQQGFLQGSVPDRVEVEGDRIGVFASDQEEWMQLE